MDAVTIIDANAAPATPSANDFTVCFYCGHVMAFTAKLKFRELNDEEIKELAGDERILKAQRIRALDEKEKGKLQ
jgi:hypothetical protein